MTSWVETRVETRTSRRWRPGRAWSWLLVAAIVLPRRSEARQPPSIAGRWMVTLSIDASTAAGKAKTVTGTMVLVRVGSSTPATYRGSYRVAFSAAGLAPDAAPIIAWDKGDSVRIVLNPDVGHGHAELVGVRRMGGLEGRWEWIGDPTRATGRFALRPGS